METIVDGTGKGFGLKINERNRALVESISTQSEEYASETGLSFNINTGLITLTDAAKTPVLYLKNNEEYEIVIGTLIYQTGASTGGSGNMIVDVVRNPTAGTIVSGASVVEINANRHFGNTKILDVDAYKGATGITMTGGTKFLESILATSTQRIAVAVGAIVLAKGNSIGINITPSTGNTSMAVEFAIACYLRDTTDI